MGPDPMLLRMDYPIIREKAPFSIFRFGGRNEGKTSGNPGFPCAS
jgi:hypothetical protein